MGYTWEVWEWRRIPDPNRYNNYVWINVYKGSSSFRAFWAARKAKKVSGLVKLEWRKVV